MTPNSQVALFLHHLWATDGSVRWDAKLKQARIYYATTCDALLTTFLARHGIYGRVIGTAKSGYRPCWNVQVSGLDNQMTFLTEIGVHGDRGVKKRLAECLVNLAIASSTIQHHCPC